jgi:hypothetical protein
MLRNEYVVIEVTDGMFGCTRRFPHSNLSLVSPDLNRLSSQTSRLAIRSLVLIEEGLNPFDLLLEKKAHETNLETKPRELAERASFKFVPGFCAGTAQEAESYLQSAPEVEFAIILGETRRTANGWLIPIKSISELYSRR